VIIEIENLRFNTIIGLLDFERLSPQAVVITIKITYNYHQSSYIDYAKVCEMVEDRMHQKKFKLLEDALLDLKELLFQKYPAIEQLFIKISKPDILDNATVGVANSWVKE